MGGDSANNNYYNNNYSTSTTESSTLDNSINFQPSTSPPSRSSLSTWWKQFRPKLQREDLEFHHSHSSHHQQDNEQLLSVPQRPRLPHMSHSSSAIGVSSAPPPPPQSQSQSQQQAGESPIFGVPLGKTIQYANVSISLSDPATGDQFVYGYIPIVVAKCGVYLKKNAVNVEGIFRLSGSARRIKELQSVFNTAPRYGKGLEWEGYNVHDAANVLRRYLNNLPEPIIPLQFYEQFRDPLRESPAVLEILDVNNGAGPTVSGGATAAAAAAAVNATAITTEKSVEMATQDDQQEQLENEPKQEQQSNDDDSNDNKNDNDDDDDDANDNNNDNEKDKTNDDDSIKPKSPKEAALLEDTKRAVDRYQTLIANLPQINRQLLMYILDLLSIFAAKSDENRMPASNLAAIFQPSILSHPSHDMAPEEYHLSRATIEFLILHSNKFLSHIETIAIKEHQEAKKNGGTGNVSLVGTTDSDEPKIAPVRRRHSKSLSSVGQHPIHLDPQATTKAARINNASTITTPPSLIVPKQRVMAPHNPYQSSQSPPQRQSLERTDEQQESDGLFSSLKRSVSFNRKSNKPRASSGSSSSSTLSRSGTLPSSSRKGRLASRAQDGSPRQQSEMTLPVPAPAMQGPNSDAESPSSDVSEKRGGLSGLFSRRSKSPIKGSETSFRKLPPTTEAPATTTTTISPNNSITLSASNPSIDQALASSPPANAPTGQSPLEHGSPRFRNLLTGPVFHNHHANESNSSLSGINKTLSESSMDDPAGDTDDDVLSNQSGRHGHGSHTSADDASKKNVSKWRRSLMMFNLGSGEDISTANSQQTSSDLLPPPTISDSTTTISPSSSPGGTAPSSPSNRVGGWFRRMKSKDRNLGGGGSSNSNDES